LSLNSVKPTSKISLSSEDILLENIIYLFTKQASLMRRSTVVSLPVILHRCLIHSVPLNVFSVHQLGYIICQFLPLGGRKVIVCYFYSLKNHTIANNSSITESKEKNHYKSDIFVGCLIKLKKTLYKLSHRYLLALNLLTWWNPFWPFASTHPITVNWIIDAGLVLQ